MNKYTIGAILVVILALGLIALPSGGKETAQQVKVSSPIVAEEASYAFGKIDIFGGNVTTEFPFTNVGEEPVIIMDATTSCACTNGEIDGVGFGMHEGMESPVTILPGETKMLSAIYDPLFHGPAGTGKVTRELILKTNSTETPEVRFRFTADVVKVET